MKARAAPAIGRFDRVDALRGFAMLWMAAFHFSFDLNLYGYFAPAQDFYRGPLWTVQRTCILSLFLWCAGFGQAAALAAGQAPARFWRRWAQVAICALLVSAGSALMFPRSWISFGVLHGIAVMLLVVRWAAPLRIWLLPLGVLAIALPFAVQQPFFDTRSTNWVGLVTHKPVTEDYVPLLPWLGVMLFGAAAGQWLIAHRRVQLAAPVGAALAPLALLGRWPLSFYMLHQPLFIGALLATRALHGL
ncbi:MAG: DUF1624 domain-containing protein [Burkholderiales bacterium]|nr:DUF1624 domain-containing protein [Burkholderiales bacterium]